MSLDQDLDRFDEILSNDLEEQYEEELDQLYLVFSSPTLNQTQFVRFLQITRDNSWDIPSALGTICHQHPEIYDLMPMHGRDWAIDRDNKYPNLVKYFWDTAACWDELESHFLKEHGLDLTDPMINWSFDT